MTEGPVFTAEQKKELLAKVENLCWEYFVMFDQVDNILAVVAEQYEEMRKMEEWLDFRKIVADGIGETVENAGPDEGCNEAPIV